MAAETWECTIKLNTRHILAARQTRNDSGISQHSRNLGQNTAAFFASEPLPTWAQSEGMAVAMKVSDVDCYKENADIPKN
ncbi:uncharacterized protein N7487_007683 [Penicillium crustosum]|uniref:uncharacterized protein n=1 Tax=Penicillium crustosum TaxID=36656 RepID=UPI002384244F|nr:uncharacterized protein N7487_007683 [Penicillium crustosum]KAJ5401787.1 hypothetical protein N7487_007683 [Penicillium crustosum]